MAEKMAEETKGTKEIKELRHFVRIANTDLDGKKAIIVGLRKIKGISFMFANAMCQVTNIGIQTKTGALSDEDAKRLSDVLIDPAKYGIPSWMFNRRKDAVTGKDAHMITGDLQFNVDNDIKMMKKIKCYKGIRHSYGLPVRGQRTRSHFRKNKTKGKGKAAIGVRLKPGSKKGGKT
jgi:small subunit ribosomal protein S13